MLKMSYIGLLNEKHGYSVMLLTIKQIRDKDRKGMLQCVIPVSVTGDRGQPITDWRRLGTH